MAVTLNANTSTGFIVTPDTSGVLQLQTGGTAAVTVDASQNVGIGTASPAQKLNVSGSGSIYGLITNTGTGPSNLFLGAANAQTQVISRDATTGAVPTVFLQGTTESMRIDSSGNVGIGTSSPVGRLGVVSTGGNSRLSIGDTAASTYSTMLMYGGSGKYNFQLGVQNNVNNAFEITPSTAAGGTTFSTPAMVIDSSGNLLVGKTAQSPTTAGIEFVSPTVSGSGITVTSAQSTNLYSGFQMYSTGAAAYRFYVTFDGKINATNTTIAGISDQRLKENIRDLDDGLASIMALQPRKFDWKEGKGADIKDARGFIAQEFEEVFPDLIDEWRDPAPEGESPYKSVRADLIPVLVKAIQEMKAIIDTQASTITQLQADVAALKAK